MEIGMNTQEAPRQDIYRMKIRSISEEKIYFEQEKSGNFFVKEKDVSYASDIFGRIFEGHEDWQEQFGWFVKAMYEWSLKHADQIKGSYISPSSGHMELLFVTKMDDYDAEFNDAMLDFDAEQTLRYNWLRTQVTQIPGPDKSCLNSFKKLAIVYGDGTGTPGSSGTEPPVS